MRRQLGQRTAEEIALQEARERKELEEAHQARLRLQALYEEEQRRHPQQDTRSAADFIDEERGVRA